MARPHPRLRQLIVAIGVALLTVLALGSASSNADTPDLAVRARLPLVGCDSCKGNASFKPPVIDYSDPGKFLQPGPQSSLSAASIAVVEAEIAGPVTGLAGIGRVHSWMGSTFEHVNLGGATIGQSTANGLIAGRQLGGCHDWALVMTAVLRHYGYPALMADTAGLTWAADYAAGRRQDFAGHVFAEIYVDGDWVLVDCTSGNYTADYDPASQVIGYAGAGDPLGFFTLFKGLDPQSYGVTSGDVLRERMEELAAAYPRLTISVPGYRWQQLPH
ncbi:MAG: transglutaminase domain-containing protein [Dehalococcoidia bacterium]